MKCFTSNKLEMVCRVRAFKGQCLVKVTCKTVVDPFREIEAATVPTDSDYDCVNLIDANGSIGYKN